MTSLVRLPVTREARFRPMRKYQKEVSDQKSEEKQTCLLSQENAAGTLGSVNWHFFLYNI